MTKLSALEAVQGALRGADSSNVSGNDWTCPAHDDESASLTVKYGKHPGKVVLRCGAGCQTADVLTRISLAWRDLFDEGAEVKDTVVSRRRYVYDDEDVDRLFRVTRVTYESGEKGFYQQGAKRRGGWKRGEGAMGDVRLVLYHLPELIDAIDDGAEVHLTEGEKDAEAIVKQSDHFATCHPMGAGKWRTEYTEQLAQADSVVVWADRDAAGYRCAHQRLSALLDARIQARAVLPIPDHQGADAYDHLEAGYGADEGKPVTLEELMRLAAEAESERQQEVHDSDVKRAADRIRAQREARRLVDAEEADQRAIILPRRTLEQALQEERSPEPPQRVSDFHEVGHSSTITGRFKTGKTTLGGNLLRSLADGDDFLDRYPVIKPDGRIGLLNYELTETDMLDWLDDQNIVAGGRIALLNLRGVPFSLASERNQHELISWCSAMEVEVLHLDPHRRAFKGFGSENSNDDVNNFTDVLDITKKEAGVRDLFLYVHTGRAPGEMGAEHARGATALDDWADNRWVMTKDEHENRFLYMDGRAGSGYVQEFQLQYDRSTRRLGALDGNRRDSLREKYRREILAALEVAEYEGVLVGELEEKLGVSKRGALKPIIAELVFEGLIVQVQRGNAKPCFLTRFAPEVSEKNVS